MVKRQGVANIVNKKTGQKYTLKSIDLDNLIKNYFENFEKRLAKEELPSTGWRVVKASSDYER